MQRIDILNNAAPVIMKTRLSHILPVWKACSILGEPTVTRIVTGLVQLRQKQQRSDNLDPNEIDLLVKGLFYRHPPPNYPDTPMPPTVSQSWKRLLSVRQLALDKLTLLQFVVPTNVQPYTGPSGHMGLFDCWVYALQNNTVSNTAYYGAGNSSNPPILLPDVLIMLAIGKQYTEMRKEPLLVNGATKDSMSTEEHENSVRQEKTIWIMACLSYRIYDSYQKKGVVSRDTVHRFLTDVYGEDSYKETATEAFLDVVFADEQHDAGWLHATVTENEFCKRVLETMRSEENVLLDWIATLICGMLPLDKVPVTVESYLLTVNQRPLPLCDMYALADSRLYEIKRRFHSLVRLCSPVVIGDPMSSGSNEEEDTEQSSIVQAPKHAISEGAFCDALSRRNDEMGSGGFLPPSLARLVFRAECLAVGTSKFWTLYHVLHFGCTAVRLNVTKRKPTAELDGETKVEEAVEDRDAEMLRLLFSVFQLSVDHDDADDIDPTVLTRDQVTRMIVLLLEFADFRRIADASVSPEESESTEGPSIISKAPMEQSLVEEDSAVILGLMPSKVNPKLVVYAPQGRSGSFVRLSALVDFAMKDTEKPGVVTFDEFRRWDRTVAKGGPPSRMAFLMLELRLVAAVQFGVPPTEASLEVRLIGEIEGRHKERYPQTETSRRGPRGTIWYLIDSDWLKKWAAVVKKVSKSDDNANDMRGDSTSDRSRGLSRINNTGLLADDGSLALRPDIRWKYDYEILPPLGWSALQAWYDGGPPIYRSVVRYLTSNSPSPHASVNRPRIPTENELELYPFFVTIYLCDSASRGEARPFQQHYQVSRVSPVFVMLLQVCKELEVEPDQARLWVLEYDPGVSRPDSAPEDWILNLEMNIVEQRKRRGVAGDPTRGITLLLELKDKESGRWPRGVDGKEWIFKEKSQMEHPKSDLGDGVVGLYNMGNTCYLNSSIQCVSHTPLFREYFTSKAYLKDINKTNPLGHGGHLAQVSAVLITSIWKRFNQSTPHQPSNRVKAPGSYALVTAPSLTPKTFKESLGKFNDHFAGNEQHDAQELLAFLLGGLSEDLNRIVDKPYIEAPDSDGRPDGELADIWWSNHLKREMSIIVALFTGQYKSLLTCRTCSYESARFEPFSFLQVPLPEDDYLTVTLVLYPVKDGSDTKKYCVRVKADGRLRDVLVALAKVVEADTSMDTSNRGKESQSESTEDVEEKFFSNMAHNFAVVDMREGYISKIAPNSWSLQDLQNKETGELPILHVYELDPLGPVAEAQNGSDDGGRDDSERKKEGFLAVAQRRSEVTSQDYMHPFNHRVFGTPLLLRVEFLDKHTGQKLHDLIARRLRNFVPKSAQRFLINSGSKTFSDTTSELKSSKGRTKLLRTTTDMEEVSGGPLPRYGFRLRLTTRDCRRCLTCPWYDCCIGCLIPDTDDVTSVMDGDSIAVDWHFAVDIATSGFGSRSNPADPISSEPQSTRQRLFSVPVKNHPSAGNGAKKSAVGGSIRLEECLDAFAQEERIPEAYCSKCKDFRVQTKRMSLWRLPPIVIIHLKRFQFTQQMRRKLRELVVFPIEGLDLSRIMASDGISKNEASGSENGSDDNASRPKSNGRDDMLYDLYGVVHHQGALSGGHYVASLKSEIDGQWRLYNDAQIYEIHARDVVDSSAYILFYIRRGASQAQLSDFWDVRGDGESVSEEDLEKLMKNRSDRCVIS